MKVKDRQLPSDQQQCERRARARRVLRNLAGMVMQLREFDGFSVVQTNDSALFITCECEGTPSQVTRKALLDISHGYWVVDTQGLKSNQRLALFNVIHSMNILHILCIDGTQRRYALRKAYTGEKRKWVRITSELVTNYPEW